MQTLENKIPPPIVTLVVAGLMWSASKLGFEFQVTDILRLSLVVCLATFALFVLLWAGITFKKASTTVNPLNPEEASALVTTGVYKITRNPMYLSMAILLLAWSIYLSALFPFVGVVLFILYINRFQIAPEEKALEKNFGEEFISFKNEVRRWL